MQNLPARFAHMYAAVYNTSVTKMPKTTHNRLCWSRVENINTLLSAEHTPYIIWTFFVDESETQEKLDLIYDAYDECKFPTEIFRFEVSREHQVGQGNAFHFHMPMESKTKRVRRVGRACYKLLRYSKQKCNEQDLVFAYPSHMLQTPSWQIRIE